MFSRVLFLICLSFIFSCKSVAVRLDPKKDIVADTGELTRFELEKTAVEFAVNVKAYFVQNPDSRGVFLASIPSKNETSEQLPTTVFDQVFARELLKQGIYTVKVSSREEALKEVQFSNTGATSNTLSIGKLKSPNYFVKVVVTENAYKANGLKIAEQSINLEIVDIETTIVKWADSTTYRKQAAKTSNSGW